MDDNGNTMSVWLGGNTLNRPMIVAEGIDEKNETYAPELYNIGSNLFDAIRNYDVDVVIFNYFEGGIDIGTNARSGPQKLDRCLV